MTPKRAAKIANDIAEDIDCGESQKELRECIAYWSNQSHNKSIEISAMKSKSKADILIGRMAFALAEQ